MTTRLAYLAGIIDGEGTVTLGKGSGAIFRRVEVSVSNTHKGLIDWLKAEFGGSVRIRNGRAVHYKVLYEWRIRDDQALQLLRRVRKYLRIKRARADLICTSWSVTPKRGHTEAERAAKHAFELAVLSL